MFSLGQRELRADRSRIITVSTIRRADGTEVAVRQSGGSLDGIGMRVFPGAPILAPGDRVHARVTGGWIQEAVALEHASVEDHRHAGALARRRSPG